MLTGFLRAFRTPDLRRKLLFTVFIIAIFRLGASLPTPGISEKNVNFCTGLAAQSGGSATPSASPSRLRAPPASCANRPARASAAVSDVGVGLVGVSHAGMRKRYRPDAPFVKAGWRRFGMPPARDRIHRWRPIP